MKDKLIGVALFFISTVLYVSNNVLTVWYAAQLDSYIIKLGKMGTASKALGVAPDVWATLALGLGVFYIGRAELWEYKERKNGS